VGVELKSRQGLKGGMKTVKKKRVICDSNRCSWNRTGYVLSGRQGRDNERKISRGIRERPSKEIEAPTGK